MLMAAPTTVTRFMDAKRRESEYAGRQMMGQKPPKSATDQILPTPHNLNPTVNARQVEKDDHDRQMMREVATESFHAKKKAAVDRKEQRNQTKHD